MDDRGAIHVDVASIALDSTYVLFDRITIALQWREDGVILGFEREERLRGIESWVL